MSFADQAPSVMDDPESYVSVVDFTRAFPTVIERARQSRDVSTLYAEKLPNLYLLRTGDPALVDELSDVSRFRKNVTTALAHFRPLAGDGMATGYNDEQNRRIARDLLLPAFSASAVRNYHESMLTAINRMIRSWDGAAAEGRSVQVPIDTTRLTLDAIGLAGFGYDFDSFSRAERHPFATAMLSSMRYLQTKLFDPDSGDLSQFERERELQFDLIDRMIADRRSDGETSATDPLGLMLNAPDDQRLPDESIRNQVFTLLSAGHETTSAALTFTLYQLANNPPALHLAQAEVDALWGDEPHPQPRHEDVAELRYIRQCLNESLRLWPPAIAFAREARQDTVLADRYPLRAGDAVLANIPMLHRAPVWGDNVERFDPDRFSPAGVESRPASSFMPFGTGERACIGRQFSTHEAVMVLGMLVHRYRFLADADYQLRIHQAMTIKPDGFELTLVPRNSADRIANGTVCSVSVDRAGDDRPATLALMPSAGRVTALTVAYGSNLGTTREYAARLADVARRRSVSVRQVPLNDLIDNLGNDPLLVVVATYNGLPTDDAMEFIAWLEEARDVCAPAFAVLGNGDRSWAATYQRIPTLIDRRLAELGGQRLIERGEIDQSTDPARALHGFIERYQTLLGDTLLTKGRVDERRPGGEGLLSGLRAMTVVETYDLAPQGRPKQFVRLALPEDMRYQTADHLKILPENDRATVRVTARALGLPETHLMARELQDRLTERQLWDLADLIPCLPDRRGVRALEPGTQTLSEVVTRFPTLRPALSWPIVEDLLPPLRKRTYSISSSPRWDPAHVDLMVSVVRNGTASTHLGRVCPGETVLGQVAPCRSAFRVDHSVPVIMVCAGTGLAPFRGAIADRSHLYPEHPALCYFGCDAPDVDYLHKTELEAAETVSMRPAFSAQSRNGHRFVQDRIAAEADEVWALLQNGAKIYVCGEGAHMASGVRAALCDIYHELTAGDGEVWLQQMMVEGRYVEDVYTARPQTR